MSLSSAVSISVSGLNAATARLEASAANVAHVGTTGRVPAADGGSDAFRPVDVRQSEAPGGGVATTLVARPNGYRLQADPTAPDADARGLVAAPDVDLAAEAVTQLMSKLSYAAALKTLKVASDMQKATIDVLR
jgi:flagellar basal-body rod protein FlgC